LGARLPTNHLAAPRAPRAALVTARAVGFWALFGAVVFAVLHPLWVGTIPALTDFGGHVQVANGWIHVQDNPLLAGLLERRDTWLAPNLLTARFAALCYPWLDPITSLRLFTTLAGVALAGALVWVARVYDRPRWLALLALPFFWGGMLGLGLLNYVAAYPGMFAALALGRLSARQRNLGWTIALAALLVFAFWTHGIGFVYTTGLAAAAFVLAAPSWGRLVRGLAFIPGVTLWALWFFGGASRTEPTGTVGGLVHHTSYHAMSAKASDLLFEGLDVLHGDEDGLVFVVLVFVWLVLLLSSAGPSLAPPSQPPPPPADRSASSRLLNAVARAWTVLAAHPLLVITVAVAAGVAILPTYVRGVVIDARLVTPLWMLLMLLPRPRVPRLVSGLAVVAAAAAAVFLGHALDTAMLLFDTGEVAPLLRLLTHLPPGTRTECVGVDGYTPYLNRVSLTHNCNGLTAHFTGGFSGGGFAITGFNATHFRPGHGFPTLRRATWQTNPLLAEWDYVIVRGDHWEPSPARLERVASAQAAAFWGDRWTLYRVTGPAQQPEAALDLLAGGLGGEDYRLACAPKTALRELRVRVAPGPDGPAVASLRPSCAPLYATRDGFQYGRRVILSARAGVSAAQGTAGVLACPDGEVAAGLHGTASGGRVRSVGLLCAKPPAPQSEHATGPLGPGLTVGAPPADGDADAHSARAFRLACPPGRVGAGVTGRADPLGVTAVGVRCAPVGVALAPGEPPRPPRFKGSPYTIAGVRADARTGAASGAVPGEGRVGQGRTPPRGVGPPLMRGIPYTFRDAR